MVAHVPGPVDLHVEPRARTDLGVARATDLNLRLLRGQPREIGVARAVEIDGHPALVSQLKNAINNPGQWGMTLMKENCESKKKIDLAVCAVGARMLARVVLNTGLEEPEEGPGEVWGLDF